jgi:hypothetical protein
MSQVDLSFESSLVEQAHKGGVKRKLIARQEIQTVWLEMIYDLVAGADYSYSRIGYRLGVSPSTIQKLATNPGRSPCRHTFMDLQKLHHKVFQGQYATPKARAYWAQKTSR